MARKTLSSLVGRLDEDQPAETSQPAPAAAGAEKNAEIVPAAEAPALKKRTKYPPKVSFYQNQEDTDRIRGAILHTMATEGHRNLSQFLNQAAMEKVVALEAKYNEGKPFPPVGPRDLPQGRPMGE